LIAKRGNRRSKGIMKNSNNNIGVLGISGVEGGQGVLEKVERKVESQGSVRGSLIRSNDPFGQMSPEALS